MHIDDLWWSWFWLKHNICSQRPKQEESLYKINSAEIKTTQIWPLPCLLCHLLPKQHFVLSFLGIWCIVFACLISSTLVFLPHFTLWGGRIFCQLLWNVIRQILQLPWNIVLQCMVKITLGIPLWHASERWNLNCSLNSYLQCDGTLQTSELPLSSFMTETQVRWQLWPFGLPCWHALSCGTFMTLMCSRMNQNKIHVVYCNIKYLLCTSWESGDFNNAIW